MKITIGLYLRERDTRKEEVDLKLKFNGWTYIKETPTIFKSEIIEYTKEVEAPGEAMWEMESLFDSRLDYQYPLIEFKWADKYGEQSVLSDDCLEYMYEFVPEDLRAACKNPIGNKIKVK